MFSLFKSPYYLKDIIPKDYIDIHNHLLPAIDDGAQTIEQSKMLIAEMKKNKYYMCNSNTSYLYQVLE
jgi:protein-tyrosine phosphatase